MTKISIPCEYLGKLNSHRMYGNGMMWSLATIWVFFFFFFFFFFKIKFARQKKQLRSDNLTLAYSDIPDNSHNPIESLFAQLYATSLTSMYG